MTQTKKKYLLVGSTIVLTIISFWIILSNPSVIREKVQQLALPESEVSYPENYKKLVLLDKKNGRDFLIGKAISAKVVNERFPFSSRNLDSRQTKAIIEVLNDSSSYKWGEFGTPEFDQTIFYYDSNNQIIGYTIIDLYGEIENYPYRSLMKWGRMTDQGFGRLMQWMHRD